MFGRKRRDKTMFLLTLDFDKDWWTDELPEITLWKSFDKALTMALSACLHADVTINEDNFELDFTDHTAFVEDFFEIMPISVSTPDRITWFGKQRNSGEGRKI